jgi:hypothetical protein
VKARRSEGPKERLQSDQGACEAEKTRPNVSSPGWGTTSLCANPNRPDGAAILSGQERGKPDNMRNPGKKIAMQEITMERLHHPTSRVNPRFVFNRRMRKTARPVVWEGAGAQSPALHPIQGVGEGNTTDEAG